MTDFGEMAQILWACILPPQDDRAYGCHAGGARGGWYIGMKTKQGRDQDPSLLVSFHDRLVLWLAGHAAAVSIVVIFN